MLVYVLIYICIFKSNSPKHSTPPTHDTKLSGPWPPSPPLPHQTYYVLPTTYDLL